MINDLILTSIDCVAAELMSNERYNLNNKEFIEWLTLLENATHRLNKICFMTLCGLQAEEENYKNAKILWI